jgi:molybdopterin converting factor small subunit
MSERRIQVNYYAALREQRGCAGETVSTAAATPRALYEELQSAHGFSFRTEQLKVAVNDVFADWQAPLDENDRIVFIPPVAGG